MPPTIEPIPLPVGGGDDARLFLETHGVVARTPFIRSSDFKLCLSDPFFYYLTRRIGITKALSYSEALTRGSWYHTFCANLLGPNKDTEEILAARLKELDIACQVLGIIGDKKRGIFDRERRDYSFMSAVYEASTEISCGRDYGSVHDFLSRPYWQCLGCEIPLEWEDPTIPGVKCRATLDRLYYHSGQNSLWIPDWKTTAYNPRDRALQCPLEMQTWHYLHGLAAHRDSHPQDYEDIPLDAKIGGMMHIIVQKPPIKFGSADRPIICWSSDGKKSGISGRVVHMGANFKLHIWGEKTYQHPFENLKPALEALHEVTGKKPEPVRSEEPSYDHFLKRVKDWYHARGEFADEKPEREANPPCLISNTPARLIFNEQCRKKYAERLKLIHKHAICVANPDNFMQSDQGVLVYGKESDYAPFYLTPPASWPEAITEKGFVSLHRDSESGESNA